MNEKYKLYQGNCLKIIDELIQEGIMIDAIITDPPYGTTACKWDTIIPFNRYIEEKIKNKTHILYEDEFYLKRLKDGVSINDIKKEWENNSKEGMWDKLNKLIKDNGAIIIFGSEPFTSELIHSNIKNFKHHWIWNKNSCNPLNAKYQPLKIEEEILVFTKKGEKVNYYPIFIEGKKDRTNENAIKQNSDLLGDFKQGFYKTEKNKKGTQRYPKNIINISTQATECANSKRIHPTQKPVDLLEYLIKTYTKEGEIILDFTMGSGSTGVACLNTNRKFIGIELDENYFNIAEKRLLELNV